MKKNIILLIIVILLCGCTNINTASLDDLILEVKQSSFDKKNTYRTGFKYYLPQNMIVKRKSDSNEVIKCGDTTYYMYVDLVSYYNKVKETYVENNKAYISKNIDSSEFSGYLEINVKEEQYLIEIMYNYAKIEVIVDKDMINEAVVNSLIILSSITYNDEIIKNMLGEDVLNYSEEEFNIFKTTSSDSNFLDYVEEYDNYNGDEVHDYDLVN